MYGVKLWGISKPANMQPIQHATHPEGPIKSNLYRTNYSANNPLYPWNPWAPSSPTLILLPYPCFYLILLLGYTVIEVAKEIPLGIVFCKWCKFQSLKVPLVSHYFHMVIQANGNAWSLFTNNTQRISIFIFCTIKSSSGEYRLVQ